MIRECLASVRLCGLTIALCAVVYPLTVLGLAAVLAPKARLGSLVTGPAGTLIGSRLIGQSFTQPKYFWPRPSACGYDASAAAGSNLSPANLALRTRAEAAIAQLAPQEGTTVPVDLVTASGAGLDPHISLAAARFQAARVARARGMEESAVLALVDQGIESIPLTAGEDGQLVNVLLLNLALDASDSAAQPGP